MLEKEADTTGLCVHFQMVIKVLMCHLCDHSSANWLFPWSLPIMWSSLLKISSFSCNSLESSLSQNSSSRNIYCFNPIFCPLNYLELNFPQSTVLQIFEHFSLLAPNRYLCFLFSRHYSLSCFIYFSYEIDQPFLIPASILETILMYLLKIFYLSVVPPAPPTDFLVLGIEPRALIMLNKYSIAEL